EWLMRIEPFFIWHTRCGGVVKMMVESIVERGQKATELMLGGNELLVMFRLLCELQVLEQLECPSHLVHLSRDILLKVVYGEHIDRKSTRLNSSHVSISYAVFCLKKKNIIESAEFKITT